MIDTHYCQLMANYNQWMNDKLYRACALLPEHTLHENKGAFFKSIYLTLNHIAYSDLAFLSRFTGEPAQVPELGVELFGGFTELQSQRRPLDTLLTQMGIDLGSTDLPYMPAFDQEAHTQQ